MKVRVIGPLLMIALGAVLTVSPAGSAFNVGSENPCLPERNGVSAEIVTPCDPCDLQTVRAEIAQPCTTLTLDTTTTTEATTTTVVTTTEPPATVPGSTETTEAEETTTTTGPAVSAGGASKPMRGTLARTGTSSVAPMTALGVTLMVAGVGLFLVGRRRSLADA